LLRAGAVAGVQVRFVPDSEPLAVWHIETDRPRISNTTDWRYSLDWIRQNRALVTPRAYASFVLIWASSTAARGRAWKACWILPREAFALGSPRTADLLAHLMIWLIPQNVRSSLSVFLAGRGSKRWIRAGSDPQMGPDQKRISVALSTRNRAGAVAGAVRTILENDHPDFELIVLDQSDNALTQTSLEPFLSDPRVRYTRSASRGRSAGQNAAIREARGALVVMTDDDCTVPPNWLREFEAAFAIDGRIGIVFGNVLPAPHDGARGCIPAYVRRSPFLAGGIRDKSRVEGIGACMAVRRSVWRSLVGFDEMLGSGTRFRAGEDGDLAVRALLAGHWIYETPAVQVTHHGLRAWEQLPDLIESYWFGTGAMLAKPIAAGQWRIVPLLVRLAVRWAWGRSLVGASLGSRPQRFRKLSAFCRGFFAGAACRVNKRTGLYVPATPACQGFVGKAT
jgi:GT2 family glycosyltransferase